MVAQLTQKRLAVVALTAKRYFSSAGFGWRWKAQAWLEQLEWAKPIGANGAGLWRYFVAASRQF
jgi:hypothetical protein